MFNSNCASVPLVASIDGNGNNNSGAWGDGGWLWIIVVFALLFGWGNNGFGGGFGGGNAVAGMAPWATQADVRAAVDQQTLISKLDQQTYGLADSTYALNNTINSNFRTMDNAVCNLGFNVQQGFNNIGHQISDCCCTTQRAIDGVNYNMATNTCALQNTMNNNTRDIIDSQNAGTRAILDYLCQDKISTLQAENQSLKFAASQTAQNQFITQVGSDIVNRLQPPAIPAYTVPNPNAAYYGCCNTGCGC